MARTRRHLGKRHRRSKKVARKTHRRRSRHMRKTRRGGALSVQNLVKQKQHSVVQKPKSLGVKHKKHIQLTKPIPPLSTTLANSPHAISSKKNRRKAMVLGKAAVDAGTKSITDGAKALYNKVTNVFK